MTTRRQIIRSAAALGAAPTLTGLAALGGLGAAWAQSLPLDAVRIVNGFPAGGTSDTVSRRVAERLGGTPYSKNAGLVENKPGAGGRIACEVVKTAAPDGATLLLTPYSMMAVYPHIYAKLSYDPVKDFTPVSIGAVINHAFTVGPMVPASVKTAREFLAWAKANPKDASYGSPAAGSTPHFMGALLGLDNGVDLKHVAYRGSLPAVADCIGGQIAATATPIGDALANHKAGKVRIIATSGAKRAIFTPEVATFSEQGFPSLVIEEWFGFYAPGRTPPAVVAVANAALNAALKDRAVIDSLAAMGLVAQGSTAAEMEASQREQTAYWGPLVKRIGFTAES